MAIYSLLGVVVAGDQGGVSAMGTFVTFPFSDLHLMIPSGSKALTYKVID